MKEAAGSAAEVVALSSLHDFDIAIPTCLEKPEKELLIPGGCRWSGHGHRTGPRQGTGDDGAYWRLLQRCTRAARANRSHRGCICDRSRIDRCGCGGRKRTEGPRATVAALDTRGGGRGCSRRACERG